MSASPAPQGNPVVIEKFENGITTLILNRPEKLNALNKDLTVGLHDALARAESNKEVLVVVLTGGGRAFCAGGDLVAIAKGHEANDTTELEPILRTGMQLVLKMRSMHQPIIAAVNGPAAGAGMNIALAADIRIAADVATFGQNFVKVGLFPDYGGTYFLPELVGTSLAAEMLYTGEMIDAKTALQIGVVNHVVPLAKLEDEAQALARKIADGPHRAIRSIKLAIFGSAKSRLVKALEHEVEEQMKCFLSKDCGEGIRAFMEKRKPKFQGK